jgi:predicted transcriptional regulator
MELQYQKQLKKIKKIVEEHPRGTTIKTISKKIGINRNVVAKYLDVLQMSGMVEVEKFGRSKVYFPSESVPFTYMFDFTNEFIIVVKKDMTTIEINNPFVTYLGLENKDKIVGKNITQLPFAKEHPKMTKHILETIKEQEILEDNLDHKRKKDSKTDHFHLKFVPTTLTNGESGVTVIISKQIL